ncbi:MAG TPA: hypothetical protein VH595_03445 [Verrucomicrobiae bacterium]|nr:hypothetical protein [Verrucomicrobiae bacterium]
MCGNIAQSEDLAQETFTRRRRTRHLSKMWLNRLGVTILRRLLRAENRPFRVCPD